MIKSISFPKGSYVTICALVFLLSSCSMKSVSEQDPDPTTKHPNIILFYVDDLGYADLSSYGAKGVSTPNVDALVAGGLKFTDAHSAAATCTPSRYSLLTGDYAFRNNAEILPGDAPLLIDTSKMTLPKMLGKAGYNTAVVGKWHLGLGNGNVDWNTEVSPGPLELGFDYSFLLPATGDRVPTVYLENHHVVNLQKDDLLKVSYITDLGQERATKENARYLSDKQHSETIVNGVGRIGAMIGGESAHWIDEDFPMIFTEKATSYIERNQDSPFFLYFSFHDIHVPRLPNDQFKGKSEMGPRGDAIVQMDWVTGQIINKLKELGLEDNTLIIFTSDNGPVLNDGYEDSAVEMLGNHDPSGSFRGGKYSAFEAGTRVPTILYWPNEIKPGLSDALVSQVDLLVSLSTLVGVDLDDNTFDSKDLLDAFLGRSEKGREFMVEESFTLALRKGNWKYIKPVPKEKEYPAWLANKHIETGFVYEPQLYNLEMDVSERVNVANDYPELVKEMDVELASIIRGKEMEDNIATTETPIATGH